MSLTVVYANSSRCVIATYLLLSSILCCVFRPDLQLNLTTKLNSKRKKAVSVLYAPDILNTPLKSVNFPSCPVSSQSQSPLQHLILSKAKKSHLDLADNKLVTHKPLVSPTLSPEEENFWNIPATSARTFKFTGDGLLMDERVDFGDISTTSLSASPSISKTVSNIFTTSPTLNLPPERRSSSVLDTSEQSHHNTLDSPSSRTRDIVNHDTLKPVVRTDMPATFSEESSSDGISGITITHKIGLIAVWCSSLWADFVTNLVTDQDLDCNA